MQSDLMGSSNDGDRAVRHAATGHEVVAVVSASNNVTAVNSCTNCTVKDMELLHMKRRIQSLEEQLCRALGSTINSSNAGIYMAYNYSCTVYIL